VTALSARVKKPSDDATVKCVSATDTVSAWYRNSSDGKYFKLLQSNANKYRVSNDSLTVLKVGEWTQLN